jgi:hypothetical protein
MSRGRGVNTVEVEFNDKVDPNSITPATASDPPSRRSFSIDGPNGPAPGTAGEVGSIPGFTHEVTLVAEPVPQ